MITPLQAAWLSMVDRLPITYKQFTDSLEGWTVNPVTVKGATAGALLVKGPELHACILPEFKGLWLSRKELRIMNEVIEKHGYAETSATTDEGAYFVGRLGFIQHGDKYRRLDKWA